MDGEAIIIFSFNYSYRLRIIFLHDQLKAENYVKN
jgi:hypothetical protein